MSLETLAGNCIVKNGATNEITVQVRYRFSPGETYEPDFVESGSELVMKEIVRNVFTGDATWTISVPEGTTVRFASTGGSFSASRVHGDFTATTGEGDIDLERCEGVFKLRTTSGEITAADLVVTGPSELMSTNGPVQVELAATPEHDLTVGSNSGAAVLDFNGHKVRGTLQLTARAHGGSIKAPMKLDKEEEFTKDKVSYVRKSCCMNGESPMIAVVAGRGAAEIKR